MTKLRNIFTQQNDSNYSKSFLNHRYFLLLSLFSKSLLLSKMYPNTDQMMVWAIFFFSHDQDKVVQYKEKCQVMEARLNEVNELSNQSRAQLGDSADVLRGLEAKLRHTEVNRQILPHFFKPIMQSMRIFGGTLWDTQHVFIVIQYFFRVLILTNSCVQERGTTKQHL